MATGPKNLSKLQRVPLREAYREEEPRLQNNHRKAFRAYKSPENR
jgi:hypothetical protein